MTVTTHKRQPSEQQPPRREMNTTHYELRQQAAENDTGPGFDVIVDGVVVDEVYREARERQPAGVMRERYGGGNGGYYRGTVMFWTFGAASSDEPEYRSRKAAADAAVNAWRVRQNNNNPKGEMR